MLGALLGGFLIFTALTGLGPGAFLVFLFAVVIIALVGG